MATRKSPITCHVLDSSTGKPAKGVKIGLQKHRLISKDTGVFSFDPLARSETDNDGRCLDLLVPKAENDEADIQLSSGLYKITFQTKEFFESSGRSCFYPWVEITFEVADPTQHYHIPLLISPFSFTTYRGS